MTQTQPEVHVRYECGWASARASLMLFYVFAIFKAHSLSSTSKVQQGIHSSCAVCPSLARSFWPARHTNHGSWMMMFSQDDLRSALAVAGARTSEWVSEEATRTERPDLASARWVEAIKGKKSRGQCYTPYIN